LTGSHECKNVLSSIGEALEQLGLKLRMKGLSADSDNWPKSQIPSKHSCKCEYRYISALLLGSKINGIEITLVGEITSVRISK
jgi:hypothetical protein